MGKDRTLPGIEQWRVLEKGDGRHHRVCTFTTFYQYIVSGFQSLFQDSVIGFLLLVSDIFLSNGTGTAVDDQCNPRYLPVLVLKSFDAPLRRPGGDGLTGGLRGPVARELGDEERRKIGRAHV